jgi:hypothetical protein
MNHRQARMPALRLPASLLDTGHLVTVLYQALDKAFCQSRSDLIHTAALARFPNRLSKMNRFNGSVCGGIMRNRWKRLAND